MANYRIVLVRQDGGPERSGYVFCAEDAQAIAAAETLLQFHPEVSAVQVFELDRLVCTREQSARPQSLAS
jgi:hypothetical protein